MKAKTLRRHQYEKGQEGETAHLHARTNLLRAQGSAKREFESSERFRKREIQEESGATCPINYRKERPTTLKRRKIRVVERRITLEKALPEIQAWILKQTGTMFTAEEIRVELRIAIHIIRQALQKLIIDRMITKPRNPREMKASSLPFFDLVRNKGHLSGWRATRYTIRTDKKTTN